MIENGNNGKQDSWVTFRPEIKVFDCTIRDGGLINEHRFDDSLVKAVYETCVAAGVDYMELGYKASQKQFVRADYGDWKFCTEDDMRRIVGDNPSALKLTIMADAERCDYKTDILPKEDSVLDMIRVACYIHQIPLAIDMIKDATDKGYETTLNLMAASTVQERELRQALDALAKTPVGTVYVVDSFGSLYSEQIRDMVRMFKEHLKGTDIQIGIHAHNNQQLAYANTIEALIEGANMLDVTINGIGRGAGNCPMELLIGFLKNPKFKLRPVLECIKEQFVPLEEQIEWGYRIPYAITGQLNQHPRAAIKMRGSETRDDFLAFYDQMIEEE
ncbi:MAG: aldolase catalytic domain-containing protein [Verrucomicrobia bacterium]|nr:aldolase catalytic domain-containing protein [Verrucomicrobiota bacterium]